MLAPWKKSHDKPRQHIKKQRHYFVNKGPYSQVSESCSVMSDSLRCHGLYSPWNSPGQIPGVGSLSLLQGIFPTQESNPHLHCMQILYQLSHLGSPYTVKAMIFSVVMYLFESWTLKKADCERTDAFKLTLSD